MGAQERANRILTAWVAGNTDLMKLEIEGALSQGSTKPSLVEREEQELLESVAFDLWSSLLQQGSVANQRVDSDLALLEHLSHRLAPSPFPDSCVA